MKKILLFSTVFILVLSCKDTTTPMPKIEMAENRMVLDYIGTPDSIRDNSFLAFSDQGAWFAFSFPDQHHLSGFSGPFLMTQNNGIWSSKNLVNLSLKDRDNNPITDWNTAEESKVTHLSHLEYAYRNPDLLVKNQLFFTNDRTAAIKISIQNITDKPQEFSLGFNGELLPESLIFKASDKGIEITSSAEKGVGYLSFVEEEIIDLNITSKEYEIDLGTVQLNVGEQRDLVYSLSFLFPEDDSQTYLAKTKSLKNDFDKLIESRIQQKQKQLDAVKDRLVAPWQKEEYNDLAEKIMLTLQNNWRSAAGGLKHEGLFPSYRSPWFQGFWAWDSWKHAVALAVYDVELAKEQVRVMYDYQTETGFIPDAIFRNNLYEENNYRDTKPPLSAWAVWEIYQEDQDLDFVKELYSKIVKQHDWWYQYRDHDRNGLCEYGSTDATLVAAKWESGMDNAVRYDYSKILKNAEEAYSLDQESVDLNAYLYAEKIYLAKMAEAMGNQEDQQNFETHAAGLKERIQKEFYDEETGWFYDKSLVDGQLIKVKGPEGWLPLWANVATAEQAESVHQNMMDEKLFNTFVPFPTVNASQEEFKPQGGYWRGPVWLDQAYFGVMALKNYDYQESADELAYKLIHNAEGVINSTKSIRENYNPVTGEGLESHNFSWSAAHYLMILMDK